MKRITTTTAALLASAALHAHGLATPNYDLRYNASTGSLSIDTAGGALINYVVLGSQFRGENHQTQLGGTSASLDYWLSESGFDGVPGEMDLGTVLDAGLGLHELADRFAYATYISALGTKKTAFDILFDVQADSPWIREAGQYDDYDLVYHEGDGVMQIIARGLSEYQAGSYRGLGSGQTVDAPTHNPASPDTDPDNGSDTGGGTLVLVPIDQPYPILRNVGEDGQIIRISSSGTLLTSGWPTHSIDPGSGLTYYRFEESWTGRDVFTSVSELPGIVAYFGVAATSVDETADELVQTPEPSTGLAMLALSALGLRHRRRV